MVMLAISKGRDNKVNFSNDINFNTFYKPTIEEECIGLKVALSCKYLVQNNSDTEDEVEDFLLPKKPDIVMLFSSSQFDDSDRDIAATKLQKVYKSYRIRRYLADLAVVCEELWLV